MTIAVRPKETPVVGPEKTLAVGPKAKTAARLKDSLRLIKSFRTSGTVTPSSPALIRELLAPIDFAKTRYLVELGPGNGCVTEALLRRMREDAVLVSLELNSEFAAQLSRIPDSRLRVVNDCASNLRAILDDHAIPTVDYVVSSLPLALIDEELVGSILTSVSNILVPGGRFSQYQYSLKNYADLKPCFSDVKLRFTLRNVPPAFVYECVK